MLDVRSRRREGAAVPAEARGVEQVRLHRRLPRADEVAGVLGRRVREDRADRPRPLAQRKLEGGEAALEHGGGRAGERPRGSSRGRAGDADEGGGLGVLGPRRADARAPRRHHRRHVRRQVLRAGPRRRTPSASARPARPRSCATTSPRTTTSRGAWAWGVTASSTCSSSRSPPGRCPSTSPSCGRPRARDRPPWSPRCSGPATTPRSRLGQRLLLRADGQAAGRLLEEPLGALLKEARAALADGRARFFSRRPRTVRPRRSSSTSRRRSPWSWATRPRHRAAGASRGRAGLAGEGAGQGRDAAAPRRSDRGARHEPQLRARSRAAHGVPPVAVPLRRHPRRDRRAPGSCSPSSPSGARRSPRPSSPGCTRRSGSTSAPRRRAEVALSIVAEIQAVFAGRRGGALRERKGPIHDRP